MGKTSVKKQRYLIPLVTFFSFLMCIAVGFSTWVTTGPTSRYESGTIEADYVQTEGESVDCISFTSIESPRYYSGSEATGFVNSQGMYDRKNGMLSFTATINLTNARTVISTLNSAGTMILKIVLSTNTAISGLSGAINTLSISSNYSTNVIEDIPTLGSPAANPLDTNEILNINYPISGLTKANHALLTIKSELTFTFASDVFSTESTYFANGTHKFIIKLGAN